MQREDVLVGLIARLPTLSDDSVAFNVETLGAGFLLRAWLGPTLAGRYIEAGEFWTDWSMGEPYWVRFRFVGAVVNRAVFEAAEVRLARDPAQRPQGGLWLLSARRTQPTAATP